MKHSKFYHFLIHPFKGLQWIVLPLPFVQDVILQNNHILYRLKPMERHLWKDQLSRYQV